MIRVFFAALVFMLSSVAHADDGLDGRFEGRVIVEKQKQASRVAVRDRGETSAS